MSNETPGDRKEPTDITRAMGFGESTPRNWPLEEDFEFDFGSDAPPESPSELSVPRERRAPVLGEYIILDRLGAGGMGQVYRARHRTMDREVAVKVLPKRLSSDAQAVDRFYA
ncbi:MAG: hypothetical protein ACK5UN_02045 [Planctomycetota bacterium]